MKEEAHAEVASWPLKIASKTLIAEQPVVASNRIAVDFSYATAAAA